VRLLGGSKKRECGSRHPDRDQQFQYIAAQTLDLRLFAASIKASDE
jgi:hypothetical protein